MKKLNLFAKYTGMAVVAAGLLFSSCKREGCTDETANNYDEKAKEDDGSCEYDDETISGELTANTTWLKNRIYTMSGKVIVPSGVTLTIEAGAIIKGAEGQDANASALVVARGGKLMAQGTAAEPIIFTSVLDDIQPGQLVGSNLTKTQNELWGGVIICGNAPSSTENGDTEGNIEGIPADAGYGKYGGTDAADNSGTLTYVSIRHGGITIGEGNEINGLTLGGVGTGTTISNVEVYATLDDGIECFGGTVNIDNALVYYQGDDGIDLDQNYSGTISNFMVVHGDGIGTDESLEIDGPEGSTYTDGKFTLSNGVCKTEGADGSAADFKSKAQGTVTNVTFLGGNDVKFRTKFVDPGVDCTHKSDAYSNLDGGDLVFSGISLSAGVKVYDDSDNPDQCPTELDAANTNAASLVGTGAGGTVDAASLFSWTAAGQRGEL